MLLQWDRGDNASGANFVVEAQLGGGEWTYVQDTTASRLSLAGYAPGSSVAFRVSASANKTTSEPSLPASPWPFVVAPALRLAA